MPGERTVTISSLRKETGMTQKEFAERYGIPLRTLQNWEAHDRDPSLSMARKTPPYVIQLLCMVRAYEKKRAKQFRNNQKGTPPWI